MQGGPFFVYFMFHVNSRQAILILFYEIDTFFDMKLSTRYFTEAKNDSILKPCSSKSGQFIDMKNVIGHMRLAALGLDIIPLWPGSDL